MTALEALAAAAGDASSSEELYGAALALVCRRTGWSAGRMYRPPGVEESHPVPTDVRFFQDARADRLESGFVRCAGISPGERLAGRALEEAGPVPLDDRVRDESDSRSRGGADGDGGVTRAMAVPVRNGEQVVAILVFISDRTDSTGTDEVNLQELAIGLGWLVERMRMQEALDRSNRRLADIVSAQRAIDEAGMDPETVMQVTAEHAQALTTATSAGVYMASKRDAGELVMRAASGNAVPHEGAVVPLENTLTGSAFRSGEILVSTNCRTDPRVNQEIVRETDLRSMVLVPLTDSAGDPVGQLNVMSNRPGAFDEHDVKLLQLLSGQVGNALSRARAFREKEELVDDLEWTTRSLTAALERVRAILDASLHPVVALDPEGNVILWSRAAEELYGWTEDEIRGGPLPMIPPEARDDVERRLRQIARGETLHNVTSRHIRRDGRHVDVRISIAPLHQPDRGGTGALAVITDITDLRNVEARLRQAERLESVGRLAGGVAHDFNNMLTTIRGHADLLLAGDGLSDDDEESVEAIVTAVERSAGITEQLLAYARRQHLQSGALDPNAVVREMTGLLQGALGERIRLALDLEPGAGPVVADRSLFDQVVMNLVMNARDAMPEGGEIRIETRTTGCGKRAAEELDLEPGRYLRLSVSDQGEGIRPEIRDRILEPFFTTKDPARGTGLGLATVDGIVDQSGGSLRLETELGEGSTFHVYLPITPDAPDDDPSTDDETGESTVLPPERVAGDRAGEPVVLLVEEAEGIRKLVRGILEPRGYRVECAPTAEAALELLDEQPDVPMLLMTDAGRWSAGQDTLLQRIRSTSPDLPVLLMSDAPRSNLPIGEMQRVTRIVKPFSPDTLADVVARVVSDPPAPS